MKITNMYLNGFDFTDCSGISKINLLSRHYAGEDLTQLPNGDYTVYFDSDNPCIYADVMQMLREILFIEEITIGSAPDNGFYSWLLMEYAPISELYRFSVEFPQFSQMTKIGLFYVDLLRHLSVFQEHFRVVLDFDEPDPISLEAISLSPVLAWRTLMDFSQQKIVDFSLIGGDKLVQ